MGFLATVSGNTWSLNCPENALVKGSCTAMLSTAGGGQTLADDR